MGRDSRVLIVAIAVSISIHAPRVGRDLAASELPPSIVLFQSTRPVWGATTPQRGRRAPKKISIHAPRVGRDGETVQMMIDAG